jgi:hypothetical protein
MYEDRNDMVVEIDLLSFRMEDINTRIIDGKLQQL